MPEPFTAAAARLSGVDRKILEQAADRFDEVAREAAARVVGYGGVMHLHGRRGRRIPVKMTTKSKVGNEVLFIDGVPKGIWIWLEDGTKAHRIPKGRRRKPKFLKAPSYGHPVRGPIMHPGSTGRRAWTRAVETFRTEYHDIVVEHVRKALD